MCGMAAMPKHPTDRPGVALLLEKEECQQSVYFMGPHEARVVLLPCIHFTRSRISKTLGIHHWLIFMFNER